MKAAIARISMRAPVCGGEHRHGHGCSQCGQGGGRRQRDLVLGTSERSFLDILTGTPYGYELIKR